MELADQHNEAIHPATETSVLPSASAPPSDGQSAPTVPKPAAASITGNVGNPVSTVNSGSMVLADQHNEALPPATVTSVLPSASASPSDGPPAASVPLLAAA